MNDLPKNLKYQETHEWAKMEDGLLVVGITNFAQAELSDLTFVELPEIGDAFDVEDAVAVVESVKAASDIYAPIAGKVVEINERLDDHPELVNQSPYEQGWLFKLEVEDEGGLEELLSADEYARLLPA